MRAASRQDQNPDYGQRLRRLDALHRLLMENRQALTEAVAQDFGQRSAEETQLLELFTCQQSVRHARRHLRKWMRPERRGVSLWFRPARACCSVLRCFRKAGGFWWTCVPNCCAP